MQKNIIGLDIGGTKITGIVFNGAKVVRELTIVTPKNLKDFNRSLEKLVEFLSTGMEIYGVGVGVAGVVNNKLGKLVYPANQLKYLHQYPFKLFLNKMGVKNVLVENDANCFTLCEAIMGKGKELGKFAGLTLGTGIGGGISIDHRLYKGSRGSAGEAGHMMADFKYDSEHYFQIAREKKDFKKMGEILGLLFANIINLLDVDGLVLGGSVAIKEQSHFLPHAIRTAKKHIMNKKDFPKIVVSSIKNSGAIGAALMFNK